MRRISRSASSNMARVVSPSGMPKPLNSVDDEPRPVPNSKRPSLRWSRMATRSATRAGCVTGGVRFQIAEPRWMRLVRAAMKGSTISEAERCECASRKGCSTDDTYLKPWRSAASASSTSRRRRACSAPPGSASTSWRGTCAWTKRPNSIPRRLAERVRDCQTAAPGVIGRDMELREIARDVHAGLQPDRRLGTSNPGLVNRAGGLVVDTFWDLPHTRQMIETYARVWRRPARRVVNTHHNGDHCWGNQLFPEAEVIGHRLCAASFGKERPELMQMLRNAGGSEDPMLRDMARQLAAWDFTGITLTPPTTLIEDRLELDLDGIAVHLIYVGPAHTAGDVVVHLPAARVVFTGDVLFRLCTPVGWEGTYERWIAALDEIVALDPAVVVPGHGPLSGVGGCPHLRQAWRAGPSKVAAGPPPAAARASRLRCADEVVRLAQADGREHVPDLAAWALARHGSDQRTARVGAQLLDRDDGRTVDRVADPARMHLDHVRGAFPVREERPAEAPSRGAVAPEHVAVRLRQKVRGQERRLAGGEALEAIHGARAPEPPRPVAPGEQAPRHDADLVTLRQQAQHQVVVLWPAGVAVTRPAQHLRPRHERRVRDRALDEC